MYSVLKGSSKINNICTNTLFTNAQSPSSQLAFCVPIQLSIYPLLSHGERLCLPRVCVYSTEHIAKLAEALSRFPNWGIYVVWGQHVRRQAGLYVHLSKPGAPCLCLAKSSFQKLHWSCTHGATIKAALSSLIHSQVSRDHCDCHKYTCLPIQ